MNSYHRAMGITGTLRNLLKRYSLTDEEVISKLNEVEYGLPNAQTLNGPTKVSRALQVSLERELSRCHRNKKFSKVVVNHILENCPYVFKFLMMNDAMKYLCVDEETFKRVTFILAQSSFEEFFPMIGIRAFYIEAFKVCPGSAIASAGFYQQFLFLDQVIQILDHYDVPEDFSPALKAIWALNDLVDNGNYHTASFSMRTFTLTLPKRTTGKNVKLYAAVKQAHDRLVEQRGPIRRGKAT